MGEQVDLREQRWLMTNKEWMATLTADQWYDVMMWLTREYVSRWTHSRIAIVEWLDDKHLWLSDFESDLHRQAYSPPHNT